MEQTIPLMLGTGYKHNWYGGAGDASYENLQIVDANEKSCPGQHRDGRMAEQ